MVILVNGVKHACAICIRGHRVKKCNHNDRPLVPIVKRGRQISQCNHCRDLRKTNQSHVKCTCAIASAPNPINGCLCEVILTCTCVAGHLQEVQEDDSSLYSPPSKCHSSSSPKSATFSPQPQQEELMTNNTLTSDHKTIPLETTNQILNTSTSDSELFDFLENDLDKYLSHPPSSS